MKRILFLLPLFLVMCSSTSKLTSTPSEADQVLSKYFETMGGLEKLNAIQTLSGKFSIPIYDYEYTLKMHSDGRFKVEQADSIAVFDGKKYWQSFHGLVGEISENRIDEYKEMGIHNFFFHNLIGSDGKPVSLDLKGTEEKHGKFYTILTTETDDDKKRNYYFNRETGFLEKIIEFENDEEFGQKKNIYTFNDYVTVSGIKLFSGIESICLTTNETLTPPTVISDIAINPSLASNLFVKPEQTAPEAVYKDGIVTGQVLGFSRIGSLITNITESHMEKLGLKDGGLYTVTVNDHVTTHKFIEDIGSASDIAPNDYILLFNNTPALWIVKAYVGMKNDMTVVEGDTVKISLTD